MPPVCSAVAELNRTAAGELVGMVLDDPAELLVPLVEDAEELEELGELEVGAVGWKLVVLGSETNVRCEKRRRPRLNRYHYCR